MKIKNYNHDAKKSRLANQNAHKNLPLLLISCLLSRKVKLKWEWKQTKENVKINTPVNRDDVMSCSRYHN